MNFVWLESMQRLTLMLAAAIVLWSKFPVFAEDKEQFYKNDYAARPDVRGSSPDVWKFEKKGTPSSSATPSDATSTGSIPHKDREKKRSILVMVYVNSLDAEHFRKVIDEALRLHDERQAFIFGVYHAGVYTAITSELEAELSARNINVTQVDGPPKMLQSTQSPTWLIKTKEGVHIVEGETSIRTYFDEFGTFNPKGKGGNASQF